ncbi:hypothetical protein HA050_00890 [Iodobacter sp. HSC-16F04]|uniref:Lipoprotein n=1 Tax=Iodobacter violaceini TaxID=3044271 RepID=A0ABX0KRJ2_9NEIS|nr:hypothetical protein [Iodobacter violacea]NHQ84672.1 hypothetical protein [Iodobacter violacea]
MKKLASLISLLMMTGCASVEMIKASPEKINAINGKTLTTVNYEKPDFVAFTADKAIFGALGAIAMISAGNDLVKTNNIDDPATMLTKELKNKLADRLKSKEIKEVINVSDDSTNEIKKKVDAGSLVFDVKTLGWMFNYFPADWTHYRVTYSARARLLDPSDGKVIAQVPCTYVSDDEKTAANYDQLTANNASLLKEKLNAAAKACSVIFEQHIFAG